MINGPFRRLRLTSPMVSKTRPSSFRLEVKDLKEVAAPAGVLLSGLTMPEEVKVRKRRRRDELLARGLGRGSLAGSSDFALLVGTKNGGDAAPTSRGHMHASGVSRGPTWTGGGRPGEVAYTDGASGPEVRSIEPERDVDPLDTRVSGVAWIRKDIQRALRRDAMLVTFLTSPMHH